MPSVLTDEPTPNDAFGAWRYAAALASLLRGPASSPLAIGIHGEWGSGKTSLLKMIEVAVQPTKLLVADPHDQAPGARLRPSPTMLAQLLPSATSLETATAAYGQFLRAYDLWEAEKFSPESSHLRDAYESARAAVADLYLRPGEPVLDVVWFNAWQFDDDTLVWQALLETVRQHLTASPLYPMGPRMAERVVKALRAGIGRSLRIATAAVTSGAIAESGIESLVEETRTRLSTRAELSRVIGEAVALGKTARNPLKLVIMVDDLDRCSPATVITLIERLKVFFDLEECVFFIAAAESVVESGIEAKGVELGYGSYFSGKGRRYLEKIIQLPLRLPQLEVAQVHTLIQSLEMGDELTRVSLSYAPYLTTNPRQVKRVVNVLAFLNEYIRVGGPTLQTDIDLSTIAYGVLIQFEWPDFYRGLVQFGYELYELVYQLAKGDWAVATTLLGDEFARFPPEEWSQMDMLSRRSAMLGLTGHADIGGDDAVRRLAWECYHDRALWQFLVDRSPLSADQLRVCLSLTANVTTTIDEGASSTLEIS